MGTDVYKDTSSEFFPVDQTKNVEIKKKVMALMQALISVPGSELDDAVRACYHADADINITHPVNKCADLEAVRENFWKPLRHAMPDIERRPDIVAGGVYREGNWIGCTGNYVGTFVNDLFDIPATHGLVTVRYAEGHEFENGKIKTSYVFIDFLDVMRQSGYWPLAPSLGREMRWLPPMTHDGVVLTPQDSDVSRTNLARVLAMHRALGYFNGQPPSREVLDEMEMIKHWHPHFIWSGPAGIGTCRGLKGFEDFHQIPFLVAFPDRGGSGIGHFIRVADGNYVVTGGWGHLQATHTGSGFLGMPPTGKVVYMRVMDFYRCDDTTIVENWVPMDIPYLLLQMGVDVFGRMKHQFRQHKPDSVSQWLVK